MEEPNHGDSNYFITNQLSEFLVDQVVKKLAIRRSSFKIPPGYEQTVKKAVKSLQNTLFSIETHGSQEASVKRDGLEQCYNELRNKNESELQLIANAYTGKFELIGTQEHDYSGDWTRNEDGKDCPRFFSVHTYHREMVKLDTVIRECVSSCRSLVLGDGSTKSTCTTIPKVVPAGDAHVEQVQEDDWRRSCFSPGLEPSEDGDSWVKVGTVPKSQSPAVLTKQRQESLSW